MVTEGSEFCAAQAELVCRRIERRCSGRRYKSAPNFSILAAHALTVDRDRPGTLRRLAVGHDFRWDDRWDDQSCISELHLRTQTPMRWA
jgi:hypothetical protein